MTTHTEHVYGIARALVPGGLKWRGVRRVELDPYLDAFREHGTFRPRRQAESDPSWKQAIPYLLLRDEERVFLMRRTKAGGDQRLHDSYSLGVGGHVNPEDADILGGLAREWVEEIDADFVPEFRPIGLLNDDHNAVGAVHLGFVFEADALGRSVEIREKEKLSGEFVAMADVGAVANRLETWSLLLYEFLMAEQRGG